MNKFRYLPKNRRNKNGEIFVDLFVPRGVYFGISR